MSTTTEPPVRARGIERRTLVKSAAWTVPVVAVAAAAPAYAASCTSLYPATLDWASTSQYTRTSSTLGNASLVSSNGIPFTLKLDSVFTNYSAQTSNVRPTDNLGVTPIAGQIPATIGNIGAAALTLCQSANLNTTTGAYYSGTVNNRQAVTFTFSRPVFQVDFVVTDIDSSNVQYDDCITILDQTVTGSAPAGSGSTVTGAGSSASPFAQSNNNTTYDNFAGSGGNYKLSVTNTAGFLSFRFLYWNRLASNVITQGAAKQTVYISTLTAYVKNDC